MCLAAAVVFLTPLPFSRGGKAMKIDDMPPAMREAHLAEKAAQKHAQRLAVSRAHVVSCCGVSSTADERTGFQHTSV